LNILFLSSWFPYPPDNGSRQRAFYLLQGLALEHRVTLVAFTDEDQSPPRVEGLTNFAREIVPLPRRTFQSQRAAALVGLLSPQPRSLVDTFDAEANRTIQTIAASMSFDAIVAGELSMAVYARMLNHRAKIFDDVEAGIYADTFLKARGTKRWRNGLTWFKYARYISQLTGDFDALTAVSAREKSLLEQIGVSATKTHIIPNGVDLKSSLAVSVPVEPQTLIYNGALTYDANLDAMRYFTSQIMPEIRAVEPRVRLKITGRATQVAQNELSDDNAVLFTGYVDDVRPLVAGSAVCVVPLRVGGGTRLKILEAMALGTPVVSTTKGAEGLDLRDGEHLLIADSPQEFAQATLRVLNDPILRRRLTDAASKRVQREYDWRVIQSSFGKLVERVASHKEMVGQKEC